MSRVLFVLAVLVVGPVAPVAASTDSGSAPTSPPPTSPGSPDRPVGTDYRQPLDRPVTDPFRAPASPYGPGNRGLEYATVPGDVAGSIGPGVVAFAGQVAGRLVVSVVHPDGLRSSLTGLATVSVTVGQVVRTGAPLGTTGSVLHLGVRDGDRYIDPARLFGDQRPRHAILVPYPGARPTG
jgi:murein DD-endopeptidase MepM/ murein hydrolase activator NlpD